MKTKVYLFTYRLDHFLGVKENRQFDLRPLYYNDFFCENEGVEDQLG